MLMRFLLALFLSSTAFGQSIPAVNSAISSWPLGAIPVWMKVTVSNSTSNFTVVCAPAISQCGTSPVAKAAATSQSVVLATPAVTFIVDECLIKTATAFAGTTTLTATVGITGSLTSCTSVAYDMNAAVSNTNFGRTTVLPSAISFNGTDAVILALTSTINNMTAISAGSVVVWLKVVFLP
jgi:hypothetical protein